MTDLTQIQRPTSDCGNPVIKLESSSNCEDNVTGNYYGTGVVISGSAGIALNPFKFKKVTNLKGFVSRLPRTIERTVSFHCKTQKVSSSRIWQIQGAELYPVWKMDEIESMLQSENIIIDGEEVVYRAKDAPFSPAINSCTGLFTLKLDVEECTIQQIYGCSNDTCIADQTIPYFPIPGDLPVATFYDDAGTKIATSYEGLLSWYRNQDGVISVDDVTGISANCDFYKVFKVEATNPIVSSFYYSQPLPGNKVFGVMLDKSNPDYNKLCNGVDNTQCAVPILGMPTIYELECEDLILGTPNVMLIGGNCNIQLQPNWIQHSGVTNIIGGIGINTINISAFNSDYKKSSGNVTWDYLIAQSSQCIFVVPNSLGATINSVQYSPDGGSVWSNVTGYDFDPDTGILDLTDFDCLSNGWILRVNYDVGGNSKYILSGQTIAKIIGGCLPLQDVYVDHAANNSIPDGSTLIITTGGLIKWSGEVSESDATGSVIEVTNIVYTV